LKSFSKLTSSCLPWAAFGHSGAHSFAPPAVGNAPEEAPEERQGRIEAVLRPEDDGVDANAARFEAKSRPRGGKLVIFSSWRSRGGCDDEEALFTIMLLNKPWRNKTPVSFALHFLLLIEN